MYVEARRAMVEGAMWFFVLLAVSLMLPEGGQGTLIGVVAQLFIVNRMGQRLLGPRLARLKSQGGPYASTWAAHGLGLLVLIAFLVVIFTCVVVFEVAMGGVD
jgi:hypothetical protein